MNNGTDVIVIGAGVVGLSAAIAMQERHYSVTLVDATDMTVNTDTLDNRVYAINAASERLLNELGAWPLLDSKRLSPYRHMHVWDASNHSSIDFDSRMIGANQLGSIVEESILKQALLSRVQEQGITCLPRSRVKRLQPLDKSIRIHFENNTYCEGRLLIVADGAHSTVRNLLGVKIVNWSYHQVALIARIRVEKTHQQTAYQVFHPEGPLAFLPLPDPHLCSIVWSTTPSKAQRLIGLPEGEFNEALANAFSKKLGGCQLESARHLFPLELRHTKQYAGDNWLLMGDAAHTLHPLAGLGLNVGLADLSSWLALLDEKEQKEWSPTVLQAYHRQRKHAVWLVIAVLEGFKRLFSYTSFPFPWMRAMGLDLCNAWLPLKRWFIEQARGAS